MGGGNMGGGYMGGMGGMGQSNGMMGNRGQGPNSTAAQNSSPQPTVTSSPSESVNNPGTVLAHTDDLSLTSKQVQLLEKMLKSGKQQAALVLTNAQRKQLAEIVGPLRKSKST